MALESIYAQLNRAGYAEPIHQYFPDTQNGAVLTPVDAAHASLINEINIKHGYQLGLSSVTWFIAMFTSGLSHDPLVQFTLASVANETGDYPLLAMLPYFRGCPIPC
jgi:hypothetical protein